LATGRRPRGHNSSTDGRGVLAWSWGGSPDTVCNLFLIKYLNPIVGSCNCPQVFSRSLFMRFELDRAAEVCYTGFPDGGRIKGSLGQGHGDMGLDCQKGVGGRLGLVGRSKSSIRAETQTDYRTANCRDKFQNNTSGPLPRYDVASLLVAEATCVTVSPTVPELVVLQTICADSGCASGFVGEACGPPRQERRARVAAHGMRKE